ncbi:DUF3892 domain-containing protein [Variovorax sp. ZT5P49]|uniref:DUF3892 domain-containing protein n=1 Tax=Variovorax sp. ZT5P49 TaxID=3443733 RepID=UPI003F475D0B
MAKWADYCISAVRYNSGNIHIDRVQVRVHDDEKNTIGAAKEYSRAEVVKLLELGKTFITIVEKGGRWSKGAPVKVLPVMTNYITTAADKSASDNLENLASF